MMNTFEGKTTKKDDQAYKLYIDFATINFTLLLSSLTVLWIFTLISLTTISYLLPETFTLSLYILIYNLAPHLTEKNVAIRRSSMYLQNSVTHLAVYLPSSSSTVIVTGG